MPDTPLPKDLKSRVLDAVDEAFIDGVKLRFGALAGNEYGQGLPVALNEFAKGLGDLKEAREKARQVVEKVMA